MFWTSEPYFPFRRFFEGFYENPFKVKWKNWLYYHWNWFRKYHNQRIEQIINDYRKEHGFPLLEKEAKK